MEDVPFLPLFIVVGLTFLVPLLADHGEQVTMVDQDPARAAAVEAIGLPFVLGDTRLRQGDRLTLLGPLDGVQEMAHRCNGRRLPENVSEEGG